MAKKPTNADELHDAMIHELESDVAKLSRDLGPELSGHGRKLSKAEYMMRLQQYWPDPNFRAYELDRLGDRQFLAEYVELARMLGVPDLTVEAALKGRMPDVVYGSGRDDDDDLRVKPEFGGDRPHERLLQAVLEGQPRRNARDVSPRREPGNVARPY